MNPRVNPEWNRQIVTAVVNHFGNLCDQHALPMIYNGQPKTTATPRMDLRILSFSYDDVEAKTQIIRLAIQLACTTKSGMGSENVNIYAIEDLLGLMTSFFTAIHSDLGCIKLESFGKSDLIVGRPQQIDQNTDLLRADVTGFYHIQINR